MKLNIKKVATVLGSALMLGATAGMAAAAAYPAPFVANGAADVAIVYGSQAANSDIVAASAISSGLATSLAAQTASGSSGSGSTVEGGDSYKFEKSSQKLWLGNGLSSASKTTLNDDDLPNLLKEGKFIGTDNEEYDFSQKIVVGDLNLTLFSDNDYKADEPTVGIKIAGNNVLTYTLTMDDTVPFNKIATKQLTLLGQEYYVLSVTNNNQTMTLLNSAETLIMSEGETKTVIVNGKSYEVSIDFISSGTTNKAKFVINGLSSTSLGDEETEKVGDAYIGVKEVMYSAKESGVSRVEFAIGSGKLELRSGSEIKMNDKTVTGISATIGNASSNAQLASIALTWAADGDQFVTEDKEYTMPGFESVKLSYAGMVTPKAEVVKVENDGRDSVVLKAFPLKDGAADINLLYSDGTNFTTLGKDVNRRLVVGTTSLTFDADDDSYFVASYADTTSGESYLLRTTSFSTDSSDRNVTTLQRMKDGAWTDVKDVKENDTVSIGNVDLAIGAVNRIAKTIAISNGTSSTSFNVLYSKEGLTVYLPYLLTNYTSSVNTTTCANYLAANPLALGGLFNITLDNKTVLQCNSFPATYNLTFREENKDGNVASGDIFKVTLGLNTQSPARTTVSNIVTNGSELFEIGSTDKDRAFVYSALASEFLFDRSGDQDKVEIVYHGGESFGEVYLTSTDATVSSGSGSTGGANQIGAITVKDTEASSVYAKNLIVIGGNCVNTLAADLLGTNAGFAGCLDAFEAKTGLKSGEAIIKSFAGKSSGKTALLVAGYDAADTTKATTFLVSKGLADSANTALNVTSATEATAIVA